MSRKKGGSAGRWLTVARDLKRRKARERSTLFVAEGIRAVEEVTRSHTPIQAALLTRELRADRRGAAAAAALQQAGVECVTVSDEDFASAADTKSPQGILAIAEVPVRPIATLKPNELARTLVLDAIQDPGNVGTLIRTAAAMGIRTVVALPGTADPWNAKVVRSAAGGHFHLIVTHAEVGDLLGALRHAAVPLWGADATGRPVNAVVVPASLALAVGNEGAGLTADVRGAVSEFVALPMTPGVESLNVAVAAGILLYALREGAGA
jgi:TrmH family RNA methyltransferase